MNSCPDHFLRVKTFCPREEIFVLGSIVGWTKRTITISIRILPRTNNETRRWNKIWAEKVFKTWLYLILSLSASICLNPGGLQDKSECWIVMLFFFYEYDPELDSTLTDWTENVSVTKWQSKHMKVTQSLQKLICPVNRIVYIFCFDDCTKITTWIAASEKILRNGLEC